MVDSAQEPSSGAPIIAAGQAASVAPSPTVPDERVPRFQSLQLPSAPFWVLLIGGIIGALVLLLSAGALLVFGLGVALSVFLVPVVNRLQKRGMRASRGPSWWCSASCSSVSSRCSS